MGVAEDYVRSNDMWVSVKNTGMVGTCVTFTSVTSPTARATTAWRRCVAA